MTAGPGTNPSLDGATRGAGSDISNLNGVPNLSGVRPAIRRAKQTLCPNAFTPFHSYSLATNTAYAVPCGAWSCSYCGWRKQQVARYLALAGMVSAHNEGDRLRFMTLTEDPKRPLDIPALSACWNRMRTILHREGVLREYCLVVEATKKGRPHIHAVTTGAYIKQSRLCELAERAGFGQVTDIRAVLMNPEHDQSDKRTAGYISKELSAYVSKQKRGDALAKLVAKRRRPMRTSRGWYPGGMKRCERELVEALRDPDEVADGGPFLFVVGDPSGTLSIRGRTKDGDKFRIRDEAARLPSDGSKRRELRQQGDRSEAPERWEAAA